MIVRRLHDMGKTGWLSLIKLLPFGVFILLILMLFRGTPGPNKYGDVMQKRALQDMQENATVKAFLPAIISFAAVIIDYIL